MNLMVTTNQKSTIDTKKKKERERERNPNTALRKNIKPQGKRLKEGKRRITKIIWKQVTKPKTPQKKKIIGQNPWWT